MYQLRAVVFDYGHTFLDFRPAEEKLLEHYGEVRGMLEAAADHDLPDARGLIDAITRRVGQAVFDSYERRELEELDILTLFEEALLTIGVELPSERIRQLAEAEHRAFVSDLQVPDDNLEVLRRIREWGLKIGLVSNAHFLPELMREDVERLGIARYVDGAVFSAEIGVRKPHPAIFRKVLDDLEVSPLEAVFVGDRLLDDIAGAQELGMRAVLTRQFRQEDVAASGIKPDHVIEGLPELLPYLEQLLGDRFKADGRPGRPAAPRR